MFAFNTPAWEECLSILITCIQMFNLQWSSVTINQSSIYIYIQWSIIVHHPPSYHHQTSVNNTSIRLNLTKHTWAHYFCLTLHLCSDACSMGFLTRDQTAINSPCCSSCPASDKISRHTTPRRPDVSDPEAKKMFKISWLFMHTKPRPKKGDHSPHMRPAQASLAQQERSAWRGSSWSQCTRSSTNFSAKRCWEMCWKDWT